MKKNTVVNNLVIGLFLSIFSHSSLAHRDGAYYHDSGDLSNRSSWMASIDGDVKITRISIPGTHDSASNKYGDVTQNQTLSIKQQLNAGIRFFDIRLKNVHSSLHLYHGPMYLGQTFNQIMTITRDFLNANPNETVLMRIKKEQPDLSARFNFEENVLHHINMFSDVFWNTSSSTYIPKLDQVRGKVVILQDYSGGVTGIRYSRFNIQDDYSVNTNWDLYDKWLKVKSHLQNANRNPGSSRGYINYLSASGGSFPYFISSGHMSNGTGASRLSTGYTTPGWKNKYPDFPRTGCFIRICTISFEGTNILTRDYLKRSDMKFAGIIVADFPGDDLISKVIDLNDKAGITINPPFSLKNNRYNGCLDFRGGARNGKSLVINPSCHGNDSQVLEYDKSTKQIKVHGTKYCLDVKDGYNLHHQPVIAYQCHNRKNQQWNMNSDKTISSLMTGTRRCLDVDQHVLDSHGNPTLSMHSCSPSSPDQKFNKI